MYYDVIHFPVIVCVHVHYVVAEPLCALVVITLTVIVVVRL